MIHALGYSENPFDPHRPGRLCRGRERWIEPWPSEEPDAAPLYRLVVTGASFSDDSASDATRGLTQAGLDVVSVVNALLPRRQFVAFREDGHPADIPDGASHIELYTGYRAGGRIEELRVRWLAQATGLTRLRSVLGVEGDPNAQGLLWSANEEPPSAELADQVFLLTGMGSLDSPPARFQPAALAGLLETARAIVLFHRDKHGPAIGVYAREPIEGAVARLQALADKQGVLCVPFDIPPMLARWDRALAEARQVWLDTHDEPFPVPVAPESARGRGGFDQPELEAVLAEE